MWYKGEQSLGTPDLWHLTIVPDGMAVMSSGAVLQSFSVVTLFSLLKHQQDVAVVESSSMILMSSFRATAKLINVSFYMRMGIKKYQES